MSDWDHHHHKCNTSRENVTTRSHGFVEPNVTRSRWTDQHILLQHDLLGLHLLDGALERCLWLHARLGRQTFNNFGKFLKIWSYEILKIFSILTFDVALSFNFLGHFCMHIWAFEYRIFMETITTRGWTRVPQILQNLEIFCKILKNLKPIYQGGVLRLFWNVVYSIVSDVGMWGEWKVVARRGGDNQGGQTWVRFPDAIKDFGWIS